MLEEREIGEGENNIHTSVWTSLFTCVLLCFEHIPYSDWRYVCIILMKREIEMRCCMYVCMYV